MDKKREKDRDDDFPEYDEDKVNRSTLGIRNWGKRKLPKLKLKLVGLLITIGVVVMVMLKIMNIDWTSALLHNTGDRISDAIIGQEGTVTTISKNSLEEVLKISELSTGEYAYNAVARAYEDDGITPKYYVAYDGMVTAGIDFDKVIIDVDDTNKLITLQIPECKILSTSVDYGSMEYIFENEKYNAETISPEAYELCEADLAKRVEKEENLLALGKENAKAAVEALVKPWVKQIKADYTVNIQ